MPQKLEKKLRCRVWGWPSFGRETFDRDLETNFTPIFWQMLVENMKYEKRTIYSHLQLLNVNLYLLVDRASKSIVRKLIIKPLCFCSFVNHDLSRCSTLLRS